MLAGRRATARSPLLRPLRTVWRGAGGATAIETAILLPLMLAFLLGIEEVGRLLWTQSVLQYASETAARYAVINSTADAATIASYASAHAFGLSVPASDFSFTRTGACSGPEVTAAYTFLPIVPQLVPGLAVTLNAKSCLPS